MIAPLDTGLGEGLSFYRLDSNNDQLWSFGADHILKFDGSDWSEIKPPDNHADVAV